LRDDRRVGAAGRVSRRCAGAACWCCGSPDLSGDDRQVTAVVADNNLHQLAIGADALALGADEVADGVRRARPVPLRNPERSVPVAALIDRVHLLAAKGEPDNHDARLQRRGHIGGHGRGHMVRRAPGPGDADRLALSYPCRGHGEGDPWARRPGHRGGRNCPALEHRGCRDRLAGGRHCSHQGGGWNRRGNRRRSGARRLEACACRRNHTKWAVGCECNGSDGEQADQHQDDDPCLPTLTIVQGLAQHAGFSSLATLVAVLSESLRRLPARACRLAVESAPAAGQQSRQRSPRPTCLLVLSPPRVGQPALRHPPRRHCGRARRQGSGAPHTCPIQRPSSPGG
jgi:hypothetical protein